MTASDDFNHLVGHILKAHGEREIFFSSLRQDTAQLLSELEKNRTQAAQNIRSSLLSFTTNLREQEMRRSRQFNTSYTAKMRGLRNQRRAQRTRDSQSLFSFLSALKTERTKRSQAWQQLVQTLRAHPIAEEKIPSCEKEVETYDISELRQRIVAALATHSDGARMVQLAEELQMEQWRLLIPVMRELQDEGAIRKEGSLYFRG